jgi:hypothetical protein
MPSEDDEVTERVLAPHEMFAPERIVLGETVDGDLAVLVTAAGREAAAAAGVPVDCDLCRRILCTGDKFYRATIGLDDAPDVVGAPAGSHNLIESTSELVFCEGCHPRAERLVDGLLDALWALRAPEPELVGAAGAGEEPSPPTVKS